MAVARSAPNMSGPNPVEVRSRLPLPCPSISYRLHRVCYTFCSSLGRPWPVVADPPDKTIPSRHQEVVWESLLRTCTAAAAAKGLHARRAGPAHGQPSRKTKHMRRRWSRGIPSEAASVRQAMLLLSSIPRRSPTQKASRPLRSENGVFNTQQGFALFVARPASLPNRSSR